MIYSHDYDGECWWCGGTADSHEHRHKRSDLKREFGPGPYLDDRAVVKVIGGGLKEVRGPNSGQVKFARSLCRRCNSERSQPFDRAYDAFADYTRSNERTILANRATSLPAVYGSEWAGHVQALLRYYVKHICCRLAGAQIVIRQDLLRYLDGGAEPSCLNLDIEIRSDIATVTKALTDRDGHMSSLWLGDVGAMLNRRTGEITEVHSFLGYRWLRVNWLYDERIQQFDHPFTSEVVKMKTGYSVHPMLVKPRLAVFRAREALGRRHKREPRG